MRILIDFRKFDGVFGGVEQFVVQLTRHIAEADNYVVILAKGSRFEEVARIFEEDRDVKVIPLHTRSHKIALKNAWLDTVTIQNIAKREDVDIIHFPYNWSLPFRKVVPCVLTIHDVIPFTFREAMGLFTNIMLYKPVTRLACRLNDVITTVSEFSKHDIVEKVGVAPDKIRVIPNGLREPPKPSEELKETLTLKFRLEHGYILNVGGIHERKNLPRLIRAFSRLLRQEYYTGKLVITGSIAGNPYVERMKRVCDGVVKEEGLEERVVFTGFITDEELDTLLRNADCLVYPSLYEGFGIPILEAMRMGTPVITSNIGGTAEVADDAAVLVDPYNIEELASAMAKLIHDGELRRELGDKGRARASVYSWAKTAKSYLELYYELVEHGNRR